MWQAVQMAFALFWTGPSGMGSAEAGVGGGSGAEGSGSGRDRRQYYGGTAGSTVAAGGGYGGGTGSSSRASLDLVAWQGVGPGAGSGSVGPAPHARGHYGGVVQSYGSSLYNPAGLGSGSGLPHAAGAGRPAGHGSLAAGPGGVHRVWSQGATSVGSNASAAQALAALVKLGHSLAASGTLGGTLPSSALLVRREQGSKKGLIEGAGQLAPCFLDLEPAALRGKRDGKANPCVAPSACHFLEPQEAWRAPHVLQMSNLLTWLNIHGLD